MKNEFGGICVNEAFGANRALKGFRRFQLMAMGILAISIGPASLFFTTAVHSLPFPNSISETATIANKVSPILPYCLGALALFSLTYAVMHSYDALDKLLTGGMFAGFTAVTMQMCASPYIMDESVGLLGISKIASNAIHDAGAIIGFGCMILWILFGFRQSDRPKALRTPNKHRRNKIYTVLGYGMIASNLLFALKLKGLLGADYPALFVTECLMLTFGGLACLVKSGAVLADRQ